MQIKFIFSAIVMIALFSGCVSKNEKVMSFDKREQIVKKNVATNSLLEFSAYYIPQKYDTYELRVGNGEFKLNEGEWTSQKVLDVKSGAKLQVRHNTSVFSEGKTKTNVYLNNKLVKEFISITQ